MRRRFRARLAIPVLLILCLTGHHAWSRTGRRPLAGPPELSREALATGRTIRELALQKGLFTKEQLDTILSPTEMTHPGIAGLSAMDDGVPSPSDTEEG